MTYIIVIILMLLLLLFFPIKIKLSVVCENNDFRIYLFKKQLNKRKMKKEAKATEKKKKAKPFLKKLIPKDLRKTWSNLSNNRYKPKLNFDFVMNYGLEDAAYTGIFFGVLGSLNGFIYKLLTSIFKVNKYDYNIVPHFNDAMFNFRVNCIFSFNLVKIIYMLILTYSVKGGEPTN